MQCTSTPGCRFNPHSGFFDSATVVDPWIFPTPLLPLTPRYVSQCQYATKLILMLTVTSPQQPPSRLQRNGPFKLIPRHQVFTEACVAPSWPSPQGTFTLWHTLPTRQPATVASPTNTCNSSYLEVGWLSRLVGNPLVCLHSMPHLHTPHCYLLTITTIF